MDVRRRWVLSTCSLGMAALASCAEEDSDPIEASARMPAHLPDSAIDDVDYERTVAEETTVETTVEADLTGDIEISARRDVIATLFRRGYADDGRRFGLVTAPLVDLLDGQELMRDPVESLEDARVVALATDVDAESVGDWTDEGTVELFDEDVPLSRASVEADGSFQARRFHVETDSDGVTGIVLAPDDGPDPEAPFEDVVHDA